MSFGDMPIANSFIKKNKFRKQFFYKMEAGFCKNCSTFQLIKVPKAKMMFNENYAYLASTSKFMKEHWNKLSMNIIKNFKLEKKSFVVEVGSNDGIFLENISKKKINHLGIDASKNVCDIAKSKCSSELIEIVLSRPKSFIFSNIGNSWIFLRPIPFCNRAKASLLSPE